MKVKDCPQCQGCPLAKKFPDRNLVPPQMGPSLRLVIGEAAGADEEQQGTPFVGTSGRMLDSFLRKAGVQREQVSVANTLSCRPPDNAYPVDEAARAYCTSQEGDAIVAHCRSHHLEPLLKSRPWERIDAIGGHALEVLTGKKGIMKWRGSVLPLKGEEQLRVMPTLHPSYLMRDQAMIPATISDLAKGIQVPPQRYKLDPSLEEVENFHARRLCFDIETNRFTNTITVVGVSSGPSDVLVVPFRGAYVSALKRIFKEAEELVGQNIIQFDLQVLKQHGVEVKPDAQLWDIMLMHHLLHPDEAHDLEYIASIYSQMQAWKHLQSDSLEYYNACDVDATIQSFLAMLPVLRAQGLESLYKYVQVPLAMICSQMQATGIKVDPNRIKAKRAEFLADMEKMEALLPEELRTHDVAIKKRVKAPAGTVGKSGKPVKFIHVPAIETVTPWDSPKQVEKYLYETLGLPKQLHAKTKKVTTDKNAVDRLYKIALKTKPEAAAGIDAIRKVRALSELLNTFLKEGKDEHQAAYRIHSNFLVHGTSTGRLASSSPNLQNIPSKARYIYTPSHPDWCFIEADFSSLENRLAAWYAGDSERLARLSIPDFNEHLWLARRIYGEHVTKDDPEYKLGKITNHGADGAMGPRKLAATHNLPEKQARELIFKWREINHRSAQWQEDTGNTAVTKGVLTNAFARKRWFWSHSGYTEGIRFLPQSTGADICFRAMVGLCFERISWREEDARRVCPIVRPLPQPSRLVLQVHDSLLVECPYEIRHEVIAAMNEVMSQGWPELGGFAIPVAFKCGEPGQSWGELKEYKLQEETPVGN